MWFSFYFLCTYLIVGISVPTLQLKTAGSNVIFTAVTEISDSILKGVKASGFNGMVSMSHFACICISITKDN